LYKALESYEKEVINFCNPYKMWFIRIYKKFKE
jgi:hypothetical protein